MNPLVSTFFNLARANGWSLLRMCERAGVSKRAPYHWRHQHDPILSSFDALLQVAGLELAIIDSATGEIISPTDEDGA